MLYWKPYEHVTIVISYNYCSIQHFFQIYLVIICTINLCDFFNILSKNF